MAEDTNSKDEKAKAANDFDMAGTPCVECFMYPEERHVEHIVFLAKSQGV